MKLLSFGLLGLSRADVAGGIIRQVDSLSRQFGQLQTQNSVEAEVDVAFNKDEVAHNQIGTQFKAAMQRSAGRGGGCSLHWSLCPNMCQVEYELTYKFEDIRGNKMKQYKDYTDDMIAKRDAIVMDLEGKASEVFDWESELNKNQLDLERLEDAFILELQNDLKQAQLVNDGLANLDNSMQDLSVEFTELSAKIGEAHVDCEQQAPCMAVPICKLHAASGESCSAIVENNMDKDESGADKNHAQSGLYLLAPAGMEPKVAICENDQLGGSFTVIQNRKNGSESFERNWDDYKNGFGTVAALDSAACEEGEFWLGNEYIYAIQDKQSANALKVDMSRSTGARGQVKYSNFKIGPERTKYQLQRADGFADDECGQQVGNSFAGMNFGSQGYGRNDQAKTTHVGMKFSTPDQDNDQNRRANCAQQDRSGWWFNSCSAANLNGFYHGGTYTPEETRTGEFDDGVLWNTWTHDKFEALTKTRMSIGKDMGYSDRLCENGPGTEGTPVTDGGDYYGYGGRTDAEDGDDSSYNYSSDY